MTKHLASAPSDGWRSIIAEVYRGASVGRALMHAQIRSDVLLRGTVLDIGGGHRQTYLRSLDQSEVTEFIVIDIWPGPAVDIVASATSMPLDSCTADTVLCFNLLEHVFDHQQALLEIRRVMKHDAALYGWVPFMVGVHGDPDDYFRYTGSALRTLLSKSGLEPTRILGCGNAFLSAFDLIRPHIRGWYLGRLARVVGLTAAISAHRLCEFVHRAFGHSMAVPDPCPSGIWFVARPRREP